MNQRVILCSCPLFPLTHPIEEVAKVLPLADEADAHALNSFMFACSLLSLSLSLSLSHTHTHLWPLRNIRQSILVRQPLHVTLVVLAEREECAPTVISSIDEDTVPLDSPQLRLAQCAQKVRLILERVASAQQADLCR